MWPSTIWVKAQEIKTNQEEPQELEINQEELQELEVDQLMSTDGTPPECVLTPSHITSITTGAVAKIPIVLAKLMIQINMDSIIQLPEPALEIKQLKKRVKLTQCLLLQDTNMLFLKGVVRKNIDYATRSCSNAEGVCGDFRHCTVDIPFSCTTPVNFNGNEPLPPVPSTVSQFKYLKRQDVAGPEFAEKDELLSGDLSEFNQISTEYFNERPYCELISSRIVEFNEYLNLTRPTDAEFSFEEREFTQIEEKMVVFLTLKILQNGQVKVPATTK